MEMIELRDLVDRCQKARGALGHAVAARERSATRIREIKAEISQGEKDRDAGIAEYDALASVGVATKPSTAIARRIAGLQDELASLERARNGSPDAISSLRAAARSCRDDLNAAIQMATTDIRNQAVKQYNEALQTLRDAFWVIEEIDDRPMLSRKTEIIDIEPGACAFRSTLPSRRIEAALESFRPALDEYRRILIALDPT